VGVGYTPQGKSPGRIGRRFLEEKSRDKELNGSSSEGYLEKARTMFQDMDQQWDLDELDIIVASA